MSRRTARRRDLRLLPIAAVAWAGTGVAILAPDAASTLALVLWPTSALTLLLARRLRWTTTLAVAAVALAVAAAAASHVAIGQPARAALADLPVDGGRSVTFAVDVVGKVERSATGYRFDAVTRSVRIGSETRHAAAPVLVRIGDRPHGLDLGSTLEVTGTAFEADAGDRAVLVVEGASTDRIRAPTGALAVAASLRQGLVVAVEGLPAPAAGLVPGLAVGDTSAVGDDLDAQMKAASLSHLTAVSGANCERGSACRDYIAACRTELDSRRCRKSRACDNSSHVESNSNARITRSESGAERFDR